MNWAKISTDTKRYVISSIAVLCVFLFIFEEFADRLVEAKLNHFDMSIIDFVQSYNSPFLTSLMNFFTFIGSPVVLFLFSMLSVVLMSWQKKRWESLFLVIALVGGTIFNQLLKWIFHRQRPSFHRLIVETGYSFPSGHSMDSFVFYGMLCMLLFVFLRSKLAKTTVILFTILVILMVGLSRIYLGVHFPSDVLAGYAAGGVWLTVCLIGLKLILEIRKSKKAQKPLN